MSQEHWQGHGLCSDGDAPLLLAVSGGCSAGSLRVATRFLGPELC